MVCALKAYHLAGALKGMICAAPARLVNLSNGLFEAGEWGGLTVEPAVVTMGFRRQGEGFVTAPGDLVVSRNGAAEDVFRGTGLPVESVDDIQLLVQAKWLVNSIVNPLAALTGLPNNRLLPAGLSGLVETLFRELSPAVREECHEASRGMLTGILEKSENLCSMLQDVMEGRPTELPWLTEYALKRLGPDRCPAAAALCVLVRARAESSGC
jgi:ketopantoate reductase